MARDINETREQVTPDEIIDAWEELYPDSGAVTVDAVADWLGTTRGAVVAAWPVGELVVHTEDDVIHHESDDVEPGMTRRRPSRESPVPMASHGGSFQEQAFVDKPIVGFDKFMDQILVSEGHNRAAQQQEDTPQRQRAARHQDRPANKTRYGVKR